LTISGNGLIDVNVVNDALCCRNLYHEAAL
jgi:hypothetical protein